MSSYRAFQSHIRLACLLCQYEGLHVFLEEEIFSTFRAFLVPFSKMSTQQELFYWNPILHLEFRRANRFLQIQFLKEYFQPLELFLVSHLVLPTLQQLCKQETLQQFFWVRCNKSFHSNHTLSD